MRKLISVKAAEVEQEINLQFEEVVTDGSSIKSLRIRDCNGRLIVITANWENVIVSAEAKPEFVEKFIVKGTTNNGLVEVNKVFDEKEKAEDAISKEQYRDSSAQLEIKTILVEKE